jgi:HSP20 family protein
MAILRKKKEQSRLVHRRPFAAVEDILASNLPSDLARGQRADSRENEDARDWRPSAEISETATEYVVRVALPGVRVEDLNVRLDGDVLTLRGERRRRGNREPDRATGVEQCDDCFSSSFSLPRDIHRETVRWEFLGGVLTVVLPRKTA